MSADPTSAKSKKQPPLRGDADALVREAELAYAEKATERASELVGRALAIEKRHARGNWLAGNIAHDQGKLDRAISNYRRALRAEPTFPEAHNDLGTAYHAKGWYVEAEQCFQEAVKADPRHAAALENLASALRAQRKWKEARNVFLRTLQLRVGSGFRRIFGLRGSARATPAPAAASTASDALYVEARSQMKQGDRASAHENLEQLLAIEPDNAAAHHLLGVLLKGRGETNAALPHLERAVALRSSVPDFRVDLGNAYIALKQYAKALECFQIALLLDPEYAAAAANIAKVLYDLGHYKKAEEGYRESLRMDPELAAVQVNLAATLVSLGRYEDARLAAERALEAAPDSVTAHIVLGRALLELGDATDALLTIEAAEKLAPDQDDVLRALAEYRLNAVGDLTAAQVHAERAVASAPNEPKNRLLHSHILLHLQRFEEGWQEYEARKQLTERTPAYALLPYPAWDGSPLQRKRVVVLAEQGLGDEIMFASCLPDLLRDAGPSALLCSRRLEKLFRRSLSGIELVPGSHISASDRFPIPEGFDLQVAAGTLPKFFRRKVEDFPRHAGYLRADPDRIEHWRRQLDSLGSGLKIGLSWRGGSPLTGHTRRTLPLDSFAELLRTPDTRWVSIQYGPCGDEVAQASDRLDVPITHWQEAVDDLDETAALLDALDLRISVCNTQIHISGALGKEVWILAPKMPDWRYGYTGERMLWYPSARMFRQRTSGDWSVPLADLAAALRERLGG